VTGQGAPHWFEASRQLATPAPFTVAVSPCKDGMTTMHFVAFSTASGMVLGPWAALSSAAVASFTWPEFAPVALFVRWVQPSSSNDSNRGVNLRAEQRKFLNLVCFRFIPELARWLFVTQTALE
jgi:hypothetical protein